jgi:hypothetical protein
MSPLIRPGSVLSPCTLRAERSLPRTDMAATNPLTLNPSCSTAPYRLSTAPM